jgi:hypothetical protein
MAKLGHSAAQSRYRRKKFGMVPVRRTVGASKTCICAADAGLSATAFPYPAESVIRASRLGVFAPGNTYLEIGGGNLRNAIYVQSEFGPKKMVIVEQPSVINRFRQKYSMFQKAGGVVAESLPRGLFDAIVVTYVLETICPSDHREDLLQKISDRMNSESRLILSVRGYPGVRGRYYNRCPHSDGWTSPRGAFVRPYSILEVEEMLRRHGLRFEPLQHYRVDRPENIHGIAKIRDD